jgi:hypothetical protein
MDIKMGRKQRRGGGGRSRIVATLLFPISYRMAFDGNGKNSGGERRRFRAVKLLVACT